MVNLMSVISVDFRPVPQEAPESACITPPSQSETTVISAMQLGASLYLPATRLDLAAIANGYKWPALRSLVICTEDAVHSRDLEKALANVTTLLPTLESRPVLRFIRPRNPMVLWRLLQLEGIEYIQGFVLPKFGPHSLEDWLRVWDDRHGHFLLPILETVETFDHRQMELLRERLESCGWKKHILCLRIGGNDLLNLLGIRRGRGMTVYDTPLRDTIADLVRIFHPAGYFLSAPVFDYLDTPEVLAREVKADLQHGLTGKTAIHPVQIPVIEALYQVARDDYEMAKAILAPDAAAVFRRKDAFCEPATHWRWATAILERAQVFGIAE